MNFFKISTFIYFIQALIFVLCVSTLNAQDSGIKGVVKDVNSQESIPFVNIIKVGTTIGTNSDDQGQFELNQPGIHTIQFHLSLTMIHYCKSKLTLMSS